MAGLTAQPMVTPLQEVTGDCRLSSDELSTTPQISMNKHSKEQLKLVLPQNSLNCVMLYSEGIASTRASSADDAESQQTGTVTTFQRANHLSETVLLDLGDARSQQIRARQRPSRTVDKSSPGPSALDTCGMDESCSECSENDGKMVNNGGDIGVSPRSALPMSTSSVALTSRGSCLRSTCSSSCDIQHLIRQAKENAGGVRDLEKILRKLVNERDIYKAAFGAARDELRINCLAIFAVAQDLENKQVQLSQQLHVATLKVQQRESVTESNSPATEDKPSRRSAEYIYEEMPSRNMEEFQDFTLEVQKPSQELLVQSVQQQQLLLDTIRTLREEREDYVEAVGTLHSQLEELRETSRLSLWAQQAQNEDVCGEAEESLRAAEYWLKSLVSTRSLWKRIGMGRLIHDDDSEGKSLMSKASLGNSESSAIAAAIASSVLILSDKDGPLDGVCNLLAEEDQDQFSIQCPISNSISYDDYNSKGKERSKRILWFLE